MSVKIDEATCAQMAKFLPQAIQKAFEIYYEYMQTDWRTNVGDGDKRARDKLFADHNAACKAGLSHIELLLKLGSAAGMETRADHTHLAVLRLGMIQANDDRAKRVPEDDE